MKNENKSHNKNSLEIPKYLIHSGKLLQFFSRDLTTRLAAKIFATPFKITPPERELMMRQSAKSNLLSIDNIKKKIMVYTYGYSKRKILLVHGWSGRGTQLYNIADKVLENKMMVISFDGPAHGLSSGKSTSIIEFIICIRQLEKKYGPFDAAIGHSFGGMALLNAVSQGLKIDNLVIIGADNSIDEIIKSEVKKYSLKPIIGEKLVKLLNKQLGVNIKDYSSENASKNVDTPTLVINDSEDKYVDVSSAFAIRQNLKYGELLMTNGLGHHKILKDPTIIQRIIDFII
jgi:pimeloyl-ACP methyl ester carboxylesterase